MAKTYSRRQKPQLLFPNLKPQNESKIWQTPDSPDKPPKDAEREIEEAKQYYDVKKNGRKYTITRRKGAKVPTWRRLRKCQSVQLKEWIFKVGDSITILMHNENDAFAVVSEIGDLKDGRYVMLVLWYTSRGEVEERGCINMEDWPTGCSWMLSTQMEVLMWDTANGEMGDEVKVAQEMVVDVCRSGDARIYRKNDPFLERMGARLKRVINHAR